MQKISFVLFDVPIILNDYTIVFRHNKVTYTPLYQKGAQNDISKSLNFILDNGFTLKSSLGKIVVENSMFNSLTNIEY